MPDERESPSGGWREVYREMDADPNAEEAVAPCPDCGAECSNLIADVYECPDHGVFRAPAARSEAAAERRDAEGDRRDGAEDGPNESEADDPREEPSDDPHEATRERAPWTAD